MKEFVCQTCGYRLRALAQEAWHKCQGKMRALKPATKPE